MDNITILYIFIATLTILDLIIYDIMVKRASIVSIYITLKIIFFSIVLMVINYLKLDFVYKIVTTIFTAWIDINFLINALINLLYKKERRVKNITLEIIYILVSIFVIVLLIKFF